MKHTLTALLILSAPLLATTPPGEEDLHEQLRAAGEFTAHGNLNSEEPLESNWNPDRPDGHAPLGVMGDHVHEAGEWMLSLRAMRMHMDGNRSGTSNLTNAEVLAQGYMVTPTEMDMDMLMLGAMYAPTDEVTLMLMVPYVRTSMDHLTGTNVRFTTSAEGLGDISIGGLISLCERDGQRAHANLSVSLPTGSINERDATPANPNAKLPYPMQLGSGTYDVKPGLTWLGQDGAWSYGAQAIYTLRTGTNDEHYTLGNRLDATAWGARQLSTSLSTSLRVGWSDWEDIDGADPELNPAMVPTADPNLRGGKRLDLAAGINWRGASGNLRGHRFALEFGVPVYEDLDGPQLSTAWSLVFGWQKAF